MVENSHDVLVTLSKYYVNHVTMIHFQLKGRHGLSYFLLSLFFLTESLTVTAVTTSTHTASTASSINLITPGFIGLLLSLLEIGREATGDT